MVGAAEQGGGGLGPGRAHLVHGHPHSPCVLCRSRGGGPLAQRLSLCEEQGVALASGSVGQSISL